MSFGFAITKPVTWLGRMEPEAAEMCFKLVAAMTVVKPLLWVGALACHMDFERQVTLSFQ